MAVVTAAGSIPHQIIKNKGAHMVPKRIAVIIIIILIFNLVSCGDAREEKKRYQAQFFKLFDTTTQIIGYAGGKEEFNERVSRIYENLNRYHQLYDIYNSYDGINNVKTINDQAGIAPVKVDREIIDLLLFSREVYELTGGKVNVAYGSVLRIWHDNRVEGIENPEKAVLPDLKDLQEASSHTDINKIIIDETDSTVFLSDPDMRLDVGAIAKGYAVEQVARITMEEGTDSCLISVGGNVRSIGVREDGSRWKVGIQNPFDDDGEDISKVNLSGESLVTSGVYERYYTVDGKRYHHIIDPETLFPADYFQSISILCLDSGLADALSTSVFNMPYEQGYALIESLPDTEAIWALKNGEVKTSSGFENYREQ